MKPGSFGRIETTLVTDRAAALDKYLYICRLSAVERSRKSSRQTRSLLAVLMERPRAWRHGYELSGEAGLKSGTLYPILIRLSDRGLLHSKWQSSEEPGRPPRHRYRLTAAGVAFAKQQLTDPAETLGAARSAGAFP